MMMNKVSFYAYAQEKGFPIPRTCFLQNREDAEQAAKSFTYPCILKPPMSAILDWEKSSKLKAYKVSNVNELLAVYDRYEKLVERMILQEWLEGPVSDLYSCNCYFDANSEPVVTFIARKLPQ
jgi:D-aspartate ligase